MGGKIIFSWINSLYNWYLSEQTSAHYDINSLLFFNTLSKKYIKLLKNI